MKNVKITVGVPENVDRLIRELCKLDGSNPFDLYQTWLTESIESFFDTGELLDLSGLARIHGLNKTLALDKSMYGDPEIE